MDIVLSLLVLTSLALVLGSIALFRRGGRYRTQAVLMLVLAAVMAINLVIWTLPTPEGKSLSSEAQKQRAPR